MKRHFCSGTFCLLLTGIFLSEGLAVDGVRSIRMTNNRQDWYYFEELEAISGGIDRASSANGAVQAQNFGPAFSSSATGVIDDVVGAGCCANGTHGSSASGLNQQITVSFSGQHNLGDLTMWNRQDGCCLNRMDDIQFDFFSGPNHSGEHLATQRVQGGGATAGTAGGFTFATVANLADAAAHDQPTVIGFTSQFNAGQYAASNIVDGVIGGSGDWAGVGAGPHSVNLDFGSTKTISQLTYNQRVDTGAPGADNATQIDLYFSNTGVFGGTPDVTLTNVVPNFNNNVYELGGEFDAQFVRMEVQRPSGGNVGGAEAQFFGPATLQPLDNPTIVNSSPAFSPAFDVSLALDGDPFTDYASAGQGNNTFIDFDFGAPTLLAEVEYTDRTSSAVPQGSGGGGSADNVQLFDLIFSMDGIFGNADDTTVRYQSPEFAETQLLSINNGDGIVAQFLRFDVVQTPGANPGAGEFQFFGTVVPEPTSIAIWSLIGLGLAGFGWRRIRRKKLKYAPSGA